ncbi:MAG: Ig-like domain-containing protein [Clostridiales bacterium]|nr:Ig-like domain-containing protein [Clostridiales bacterium]
MKTSKRKSSVLALVLALTMVFSCIVVPAPSQAATILKVTAAKKTVTVGSKITIKANVAATFKSSNTKIATVSSKGVVTGKKAGKVKITVTAKNDKKQKKTITITVKSKPATITLESLYPLTKPEDALADGGYSVSFEAKDLVKEENGYKLTVEVFDYDKYDKAQAEKLTVGSKIQYCGKLVTVKSVEKHTKKGYIIINGGIENGGIELTLDDGLYRTITVNDYPIYYSIGEIAIPVSGEMEYVDSASNENPGDPAKIGTIKELEEALKSSDEFAFSSLNTSVTVRGGQIIQVIRIWTP